MKNFISRFLFSCLPIQKYEVREESMMPFFKPGQVVFVHRFAYIFLDPKISDIIVFRSPIDNKFLLKEITKIKNGKYFVLGKNKKKSVDSRKFGFISKDKIVGKVIL